MSRREFFHDPAAPPALEMLPAAYAIVRNHIGHILLVRRADDGNWELPGGRIDIGEAATTAVLREVFEEVGLTIDIQSLAGVYTDPQHILAYPDGKVHQQVAICFHATTHDTQSPRPDAEETTAAAWFEPDDTTALPMHPAVRQRLTDAITQPDRAHFD